MEKLPWIANWVNRVYQPDLFRQSSQQAGSRLSQAESGWRLFCLMPTDFLKTASGEMDYNAYRSLSAFLMYHWGAGDTAGLSLGNALCGRYNAAFVLLRSFLELAINGALFECLAFAIFRDTPSQNLKTNDSLRLFAKHISDLVKERNINATELETDTAGLFDILRGDWMLKAFRIDMRSKVQQLADWGMFNGLPSPMTIVRQYRYLSDNVHEWIEYTDVGRANEEGMEIFEWPTPILSQSLTEFLNEFHHAIESGIIVELNLLNYALPAKTLSRHCLQAVDSQQFKAANLRHATKLVKRWAKRQSK